VLTPHEIYLLYLHGPHRIIRLIEDLYEHIASNEPPLVRTQRLDIESQHEVIRKL
jgi:hypothetical protein